jgi:hypothetical protein
MYNEPEHEEQPTLDEVTALLAKVEAELLSLKDLRVKLQEAQAELDKIANELLGDNK